RDAAEELVGVEADARDLHRHREGAAAPIVDDAALRLDAEPPLSLLLCELTPMGPVHDHQVPARRDHQPQAQAEDAAPHPQAHADPLARLGPDAVALGRGRRGGSPAPTHGVLRSATVASSFGSEPTSGSVPAGKMRSTLGSSMPSRARPTRSTRSGVWWAACSSSSTRL